MDSGSPPSPARVDDVDLAWVRDRVEPWRALHGASLDPTPFFAPRSVGAHADAGYAGGVRVLVARQGERWIGLLPYRPKAGWVGWRRVGAAWLTPYMPSGDALVDADAAEAGWSALLDGMAAASGRFWVLPRLTLEGRSWGALSAELLRRSWASAVLEPFARPMLERRSSYPAYSEGLARDRRRSVERRWRQLRAAGNVAVSSASGGPDLDRAVESFLALEAAGWKGRRGTAMGSRPVSAALARSLFGSVPKVDEVAPRADLLTLQGRPIAASVALVSGGTCFLLKLAYDETHRRFAPGLLLEDAIVRSLHETGFAMRLNSCATEEGGHLDGLYPDRERVGDLVIATDPSIGAGDLARAVRQEKWRRSLLAAGKRHYRRLATLARRS